MREENKDLNNRKAFKNKRINLKRNAEYLDENDIRNRKFNKSYTTKDKSKLTNSPKRKNKFFSGEKKNKTILSFMIKRFEEKGMENFTQSD